MAKRPSARRTSDADDVDDDGYAWESPKKKGKDTGSLKKSATGRAKAKRPSADDEEDEPAPKAARSSTGKKTGKTSGSAKLGKSGSTRLEGSSRTKKSGSTRRPSSADDEDDEGSTSGRRRRAGPPRKKQDNNAVILISIVTITVLLIGGLVLRGQMATPVDAPNHQNELDRILALGKEGEQAFRAWNNAKNGKGGNEQQAYNECRTKLQTAIEQLTGLLSQPPYCDGEGNTLPEYEGYEPYMQKWAELLVDVEKGSVLNGG